MFRRLLAVLVTVVAVAIPAQLVLAAPATAKDTIPASQTHRQEYEQEVLALGVPMTSHEIAATVDLLEAEFRSGPPMQSSSMQANAAAIPIAILAIVMRKTLVGAITSAALDEIYTLITSGRTATAKFPYTITDRWMSCWSRLVETS